MRSLSAGSPFGFVNFVTMLKSDYRFKNIFTETKDGYGASARTVERWKVRCQESLYNYLVYVDGLQVGGKDELAVVDETAAAKVFKHITRIKDICSVWCLAVLQEMPCV